MKLVVSAALLALLIAAPAYTMQEPDKDKPQEPKKEEPKKQEPDRQQPQDKEKQQPQDKPQADRAKQNDKQQQQVEKDRAKQDKTAQDHPAAQPNGGNRRVIKEEDFRAHFGREHAFRVARRDDRRFNYGGYWFVYSDPWPSAWSYNDDVYVDEIDGQYYLIDPVHPGIHLLIVISD